MSFGGKFKSFVLSSFPQVGKHNADSVWLSLRLFLSISANALYIIWNFIFFILYRDPLVLAVVFFYAILVGIRYALLRAERKPAYLKNPRRVAFYVGIMMLMLDLSMIALIIYTIVLGLKKSYSPLAVLPQAAFSLYCLGGALFRIASHVRSRGAISVAVDTVSLIAALFSVFNLANYVAHTHSLALTYESVFAFGTAAALATLFAAVMLISKNLPHYWDG